MIWCQDSGLIDFFGWPCGGRELFFQILTKRAKNLYNKEI